MDLSQRQMSYAVGDLLGDKAELVLDHDAPHGNASPGDAGAAPADARCLSNQAANFHKRLCAHVCNLTQFGLAVNLASILSAQWGTARLSRA